MATGYTTLNRIVHRVLEEVRATREIAKVTSVKGAITTFWAKIDIQIMNRNGFQEPSAVRKRLIKKHEVMLEFLEKRFSSFLDEYDYDRPLGDNDLNLQDRIWVCWWQGLENAPELVKKCIESIQCNAGSHEVTVITEKNYKDYVNIPKWVEEKHKAGIISRTHYSDLLRLSLLAEHGGMWLDATFFCVGSSLERYFDKPIWSIKRPEYAHCSVACGQFATYSLKCSFEHRWIFATIRDFFLHYWKENDILIDYLLFDYMIVLAQRYDKRIADAFKNIIPNNPCCDDLGKVLGEPYDAKVWKGLKEETSLFKLSWKQEFPKKKDEKDTFYAKLLEGTL